MARKRILNGGKRDELIDNALKLFLEYGYENTSIRMILDSVGGEVGMFYHYFKSKDEIFNEVIKLFLAQYEQSFSDILYDDCVANNLKIDAVFELLQKSISKYKIFKSGKFHWSMQIALNQLTLKSLVPHIAKYINSMRDKGEIGSSAIETDLELANAVLYSSFSILHQDSLTELTEEEFEQKKQTIKGIVYRILDLKRNT
ncbi:bacterial regulatory s, tetR family protein [Clostridioides difficile CD160]|nr:bacterial regulatory s, tetR family protein [Clostridioides difficile CD160]MBY2479130.1 TetR/AcrR family transcriptional regulator [Clostridioides difficile]